jgi:uncharacterized membrane protein
MKNKHMNVKKIWPMIIVGLMIAFLLSGSAMAETVATSAPAAYQPIGERITHQLQAWGIPDEAAVLIISMLPIVELRGALPVAINLLHMNPVLAYVLAVVGNMIPVVPILLFLGPMSRRLSKYKLGQAFFEWFFARARRKSGSIEKYETLGLAMFVAIPLPVTGAWTGCAAAFLCGIKFKHAFWAILAGVMIAGVIVTTLCLLGWLGAIIAGVVLMGLMVVGLLRMFNNAASEKKILDSSK